MTARVLMLAPSVGLGGGIERYAETLEWAFDAQGVASMRVRPRSRPVSGVTPGCWLRPARFYAGAWPPTRLVVVHRALLPVACLLAREATVQWGFGGLPRW